MNRTRHLLRKQWILAAVAMAAFAQSQGPAFEVAAIKPNHSGAGNSGFRRAGAGELNAINITLKRLIAYAYDLQDYQITGGANWLESERYDILAKPPSGEALPSTNTERTAQLRLRVRALLSDRFQLTFHKTTKELPIFVLLVGKNGPKLNEAKAGDMELLTNGHHLTCRKVPVERFAGVFLQGQLRRSVIDKTGLQGDFDFTLDWTPDEGPGKAPGAESASPGDAPSFFTALQEQLGLKLEPAKGPVEILVIDRAERASEN